MPCQKRKVCYGLSHLQKERKLLCVVKARIPLILESSWNLGKLFNCSASGSALYFAGMYIDVNVLLEGLHITARFVLARARMADLSKLFILPEPVRFTTNACKWLDIPDIVSGRGIHFSLPFLPGVSTLLEPWHFSGSLLRACKRFERLFALLERAKKRSKSTSFNLCPFDRTWFVRRASRHSAGAHAAG